MYTVFCSFRKVFGSVLLTIALLTAVAGTAWAAPINISTTLTGDPRPANPDNLNVDVTIVSATDQSTASWTVDLDMAASHPSVKLGGFFFNMAGLATDYSLGTFSPAGWDCIGFPSCTTPVTAPGSGSASFMFGVEDLPGPPSNDVTNSVNLTFILTKLTGNFVATDFLTAPQSCSEDLVLGCGQLGAHLQSLSTTTGDGTTNSGFALGIYGEVVPPEVNGIPEPGTLLLLGSGLAGLGATGFRRRFRIRK